MKDVKYSQYADDDLLAIFRYTESEWGLEQAEKYLRLLEKVLNTIRSEPLGIITKSRDEIIKGCRSCKAEHHYFFYRVKNDRIEIARILHERMDFHRHVKKKYFPQ